MNTLRLRPCKIPDWCPVTASAEQLFAQNIWCECRQSTHCCRFPTIRDGPPSTPKPTFPAATGSAPPLPLVGPSPTSSSFCHSRGCDSCRRRNDTETSAGGEGICEKALGPSIPTSGSSGGEPPQAVQPLGAPRCDWAKTGAAG